MSVEKIVAGKFVNLTYSITDGQGAVVEQNHIPESLISAMSAAFYQRR